MDLYHVCSNYSPRAKNGPDPGVYCLKLGPSINRLVTGGNTKSCCRGFVLALFQSITANKIDSEQTREY